MGKVTPESKILERKEKNSLTLMGEIHFFAEYLKLKF